jgi:hypothetical protein
VRNCIVDAVERISAGLRAEVDEEVEVWFDYLSVPQWDRPSKERIISVIPDIFHDAEFTLILLEDVDNHTLNLLRHGQTQTERIAGVTNGSSESGQPWNTCAVETLGSWMVITVSWTVLASAFSQKCMKSGTRRLL